MLSSQNFRANTWTLAGFAVVAGLGVSVSATADPVRLAQNTDSINFSEEVWPIFLSRCVKCHGPETQKGDLRLDSPEAIEKGGAFGPVIKAGEPDESVLYEFITLDPDEDEAMPAEGDPLTDEQKDLIYRWIEQGASLEGWHPDEESVTRYLAEQSGKSLEPDPLEILAEGVSPADESLLAAVKEDGAIAMPLGLKTPLVRVNYQLVGDEITDEHLAKLPPLANQLVWLNLAGSKITDAGLAHIAKLPKLTKLHLENTAVSDEGLKHLANLEHLEYLNLYNTKVSDAGLSHLEGLGKLRNLYVWQSEVTQDGARALQAKLPEVEVNLGWDLVAEAPAAEKAKEEPSKKKHLLHTLFDEGSCCAKAHAAGEECGHPCCQEAAANGKVCTKCNPGAVDKLPELFSKRIGFNRHIRPILSNKCFACHGPDANKRKADLRFDSRDGAIQVLSPGDVEESKLVAHITHDDVTERMPPQDWHKSLTDKEIILLVQWVDQGAEYERHWAFIPPTRVTPPAVPDESWVRNPIDRFVLATLEERGLSPSPEAEPITLVRRLHFDLLGLPPEPEAVDAFVNDSEPGAYGRMVERLLASPHYGERMAIDWLDQVRYADTTGYHSDDYRSVYPYRDYVIESFNENKPFDQFTVEQLAGDLLPNPTTEQKVASGYNRLNQITSEGGAQPKEYLAKYAADRVRNVSSVWMGATMGCAECHDHKFDPYTTKDFYSLAAFFADIKEPGKYEHGRNNFAPFLQLPAREQEERLTAIKTELAELEDSLKNPSPEVEAAQAEWEASIREQLQAVDRDWAVAVPSALESSGGATLEIQEDGSVVSAGENPAKDTYVVTVQPETGEIAAFRVEVLSDNRFENRLARGNGNFVLTGVEAELVTANGSTQQLEIANAEADYEQPNYPVSNTIDDDDSTGWAVNGHEIDNRDREAMFTFAEPVSVPHGAALRITLRHDSKFAQHNIGRFRVSLTDKADPAWYPLDVDPAVKAALRLTHEDQSARQRYTVKKYYQSVAPELLPTRDRIAKLKKEKMRVESAIPTTLVTESVEPRVMRVLPRGNWMDDSGEIVEPNAPSPLPPLEAEGDRATRLDLAEWLVSRDNPLTARAVMNRLWEQFFGAGLSRVLDDLGSQGEWPTHPELLDWLAVEFMESGWDMKHMVRLIVNSSVYRQASGGNPAAMKVDPANRLLARQTRFRLEAELVRDNALAVSGLLTRTIGGPSVKPYQPEGYYADTYKSVGVEQKYEVDEGPAQYRRGLYTFWKRSFLHPSMLAFDAPTREECVAERTESNTPLQALVLLNDPTYVEAARKFAERIIAEGGDEVASRIDFAYRQALSRYPMDHERAVIRKLYGKHLDEFVDDSENVDGLLRTGFAPVADFDKAELAAWTSVARVILNLHETITRA